MADRVTVGKAALEALAKWDEGELPGPAARYVGAVVRSARPVDDPAERVRALHRRLDVPTGNAVCSHCWDWSGWPCPTIAALDPPAAPEAEAPTCALCDAPIRPWDETVINRGVVLAGPDSHLSCYQAALRRRERKQRGVPTPTEEPQ